MGTLTIQLFGTFRLLCDNLAQEIRVIPNVQSLLAFLLVQPGRFFPRDGIAGLLWGERTEEQAHSCLNTALWRLRRALEPDEIPRGSYLVCRSSGEIGFNWESDFWLDINEFESCARRILALAPELLSEEDAGQLEKILPLYQGDFMENCQDNWVLGERERMRSLYMRCLAHSMVYARAHGQPEEALAFGERILKIDPLREEIHRELMRIYAQTGRRALAVLQYEVCRSNLMAELGLLPMAETRQLHSQIVGEGTFDLEESSSLEKSRPPVEPRSTGPDAGIPAEAVDLQQAFKRVSSALDSLEQTRRDIQNAYTLLQRMQPPP